MIDVSSYKDVVVLSKKRTIQLGYKSDSSGNKIEVTNAHMLIGTDDLSSVYGVPRQYTYKQVPFEKLPELTSCGWAVFSVGYENNENNFQPFFIIRRDNDFPASDGSESEVG